jgi:RIO-like serine/threonine protein kinase
MNNTEVLNVSIVNPIDKKMIKEINSMYLNDNIVHKGKFERSFENSETSSYKNFEIKVFKEFGESKNDAEFLMQLQDNDTFVKLYYYVEDKFIVTEKVEGISLQYYKRSKKHNIVASSNFKEKLLEAYKFANAKEIYFHNINPNKIMVSNNGDPVIIDIGYSYTLDPDVNHIAKIERITILIESQNDLISFICDNYL